MGQTTRCPAARDVEPGDEERTDPASVLARCPLTALAAGPAFVDGYVLVQEGQRLRAFPERCPHGSTSFSKDSLRRGVLTCPGHGWRYRLADGMPLNSRRRRPLMFLRTQVVDGHVLVMDASYQPMSSMRNRVLARFKKVLGQHDR